MTSSASVTNVVNQLQHAIRDRVPLKSVVEIISSVGAPDWFRGADPREVRDFVFVAARIHKMCDKFERDRVKIARVAVHAATSVGEDWGSDSKSVAQYTWSLATMGVQPNAWPNRIESLLQASTTNNKELCNVLWALSKWDSLESDTAFRNLSEKLIDPQRAATMNDDDLVSLLRATATIHEYRK